jgi:putative Holliday junction resolvase
VRILGIDHGNKRIGVAVSDPLGITAAPLTILGHVARVNDAQRIVELAEEYECELILVGLPLDSDGSVGARARSVNRFIEEVRNQTSLPVIAWDESNSTKKSIQASIDRGEKRKKRSQPMDDQAAAIILQDYLDIQSHIAGGHSV